MLHSKSKISFITALLNVLYESEYFYDRQVDTYTSYASLARDLPVFYCEHKRADS